MITTYEPLRRKLVTISQDHATPEYPGRQVVTPITKIRHPAKPRRKYDPRENLGRNLDIFA